MLAPFRYAALIACASLSTAALAAPSEKREQVEVRYGDLDLATATGVRQLNARISAAASKLCVELNGRGGERLGAVMRCRKLAMTRAAPAVELAINEARGGKQLAQNMISLSDR